MEQDLILLLHISFAFFIVVGSSMALYAEVNASRTSDPLLFGAFIRMTGFAGKLAGTGSVLASVFGTILAWRAGWELTDGWLMAAYAAAIIAVVVPPLTLVRQTSRVAALMPKAIEQGSVLEEQKAILHSPVFVGAAAFMWALLVFIMVDMVFKPF